MVKRLLPRYAMALAALWSGSAAGAALGPQYEVIEPDMLEELQGRMHALARSGELQRRLDEGLKRAENSVRHPSGPDELPAAVGRRTHYVDPTVVVPHDVRTPDGTVLARAGDKVNPLRHVSWPATWLFFDGRQPAQVQEAKRLLADPSKPVKPILVAGNYIDAARALGRRVYFDQHGLLVRRFGIRATPATVSQEGLALRVDEYPVGDRR